MIRLPTLLLLLSALALQASSASVPLVEAPDLTRRPDLLGKTVAVEGRVRLYLLHEGRGFDEIELKETPVQFRLPRSLWFQDAPDQHSVRLQGTLRKQGGGYVMDVQSLRLLPEDRERLQRALDAVPTNDYQDQLAWTDWALRRARIYHDDDLAEIARQAEAQALRIQAESPAAQAPDAALALARRARDHQVPEPIPSALVHRAYASKIQNASSVSDLARLVQEVQNLLPASSQPTSENVDHWTETYQRDPFTAYRIASPSMRRAYDRKLLADLLEKWFQARARANPEKTLEIAEEAKTRLPDRPQVAASLFQKGLAAVASDVETLSREQLMELVEQYNTIGQPERGQQLIRAWLEDERQNRISRSDAEGRVVLADKYLAMLGDKQTAAELLQEAWRIDPGSRTTSAAFRHLGFEKQDGEWVKTAARPGGSPAPEPAASDNLPPTGDDDPLLRLTPQEVVARLGKPDHKSQVVTQGIVMIQWTYRTSRGSTQYILFRKQAGLPATVIGRYSDR